MSIGIESSKEGHDESHINDTKLIIIDDVTIGLTQKVLTQRMF